jgi:hypothetical protein
VDEVAGVIAETLVAKGIVASMTPILEETALDPRHALGVKVATLGVELPEDVRHVHSGRALADEQGLGDLPVRAAESEQLERLALAYGQTVRCDGRAGRASAPRARAADASTGGTSDSRDRSIGNRRGTGPTPRHLVEIRSFGHPVEKKYRRTIQYWYGQLGPHASPHPRWMAEAHLDRSMLRDHGRRKGSMTMSSRPALADRSGTLR